MSKRRGDVLQPVFAGVMTAVVGFGSSVAVVLAGLGAMGRARRRPAPA